MRVVVLFAAYFIKSALTCASDSQFVEDLGKFCPCLKKQSKETVSSSTSLASPGSKRPANAAPLVPSTGKNPGVNGKLPAFDELPPPKSPNGVANETNPHEGADPPQEEVPNETPENEKPPPSPAIPKGSTVPASCTIVKHIDHTKFRLRAQLVGNVGVEFSVSWQPNSNFPYFSIYVINDQRMQIQAKYVPTSRSSAKVTIPVAGIFFVMVDLSENQGGPLGRQGYIVVMIVTEAPTVYGVVSSHNGQQSFEWEQVVNAGSYQIRMVDYTKHELIDLKCRVPSQTPGLAQAQLSINDQAKIQIWILAFDAQNRAMAWGSTTSK